MWANVICCRQGFKWGHCRGTWNLKVEPTGFLFGEQATFRLNISVTHLIMPSTAPEDGVVNINSSTSLITHSYGKAIGVLLGFPVLIATPFLVWVATQDPEELLT